MRLRVLFLTLMLMDAMNAPSYAATFDFYMPWDDNTQNVTDFSTLNHKPAGVSGYVSAQPDGHLYLNSGADRIKFFGVNMTYSSCFPEIADAGKIAARLAKLGVNMVRFHLMDANWGGRSLIRYSAGNSRSLDPVSLARLDNLFAALKANGIYANINLLAGRSFVSADGLPASIDSMEWKDKQTPAMFNPAMIALQKEFAQQVLEHTNTITGYAYKDDPAVVFVETCNEHGLVHAWLSNMMENLGSDFVTELQGYWGAWLQNKYGTFAAVDAAWGVSEAYGPEKLLNPSFASGTANWALEQAAPAVRTYQVFADGYAPGYNSLDINVTTTSPTDWHVQLNQSASLTAGHPYTISFSAKADANTQITLAVQEVNGSWETYFTAPINLTTNWQRYEFTFEAAKTTPNARVNFSGMADEVRTYSFSQFSFKQGGAISAMAPGETDINSINIFYGYDKASRTADAKADWVDFLYGLEEAYWSDMNDYLKNTLNIRGLTIGTVIGNSTPNIMDLFDVIDSHAYWQHPSYAGEQWVSPWWVINSSLLTQPNGGTISGLGMKRVHGKPFTVTEYNHPIPNTFDSETYIILAAYAAFQDWDAIYPYTYADGTVNWSANAMSGHFGLDKHPGKMSSFIPAAAMFRRGDISAGSTLARVGMNEAFEKTALAAQSGGWRLIDAEHAGMDIRTPLLFKSALVTGGASLPAGLDPSGVSVPGTGIYPSEGGQLTWDSSAKTLVINSDKTKGIVGYSMGQTYNLNGFIIRPLSAMQNWASITAVLKQGATIASGAQKILITASGFVTNTGMVYRNYPSNTDAGSPPPADIYMTMQGPDWGTGPVLSEGIGAQFVIPYPYLNVKVYALDGSGNRKFTIPVISEGGNARFNISDANTTLWYEIEIFAGPAPTDTYTPTATPTETPGGPTRTFTPTQTPTSTAGLVMIDDCEDLNSVNLLGGYWYTYADAASTITPPNGAFAMNSAEGADGTSASAGMSGYLSAANQYAGIGTGMNPFAGTPNCTKTDISMYTGLSFYAKGDGGTYIVKLTYEDGSCQTLTGYNDYKHTFTAPATWTLFELPFAALTQETGAGQAPLIDVLRNASNLQWQATGAGHTFELCVDQVAFFNSGPAATGTGTATVTSGQTQTFTATATPSDTATYIAALTNTATPTFSATYSYTPTFTHTPTMTLTFTATPTGTATNVSLYPVTPASTPAKDVKKAFAYPSIYTGRTGGIIFAKLPKNAAITIYNLKGELVYNTSVNNGNGSYFWQIEGQKRSHKLAPGIYIYVITGEGGVRTGKFAVVK